MRQIFVALLVIVAVITLIVITFTINQVSNEEKRLLSDLEYRSVLLADSMRATIEPDFVYRSQENLQEDE